MKISIQRQCDGRHPDLGDPNDTCEARIEISYEIRDGAPHPEWDAAFAAVAVTLGWRRIGGAGDLRRVGATDKLYLIPDAKTWIVCPDHRKGCVCARCGFEPCSCMGGPRFDVRPDPYAEDEHELVLVGDSPVGGSVRCSCGFDPNGDQDELAEHIAMARAAQ